MTKNVNIELPDELFEELKEFKENMGLTWKGMLVWGILEVKNAMRKSEAGKEAEEE